MLLPDELKLINTFPNLKTVHWIPFVNFSYNEQMYQNYF